MVNLPTRLGQFWRNTSSISCKYAWWSGNICKTSSRYSFITFSIVSWLMYTSKRTDALGRSTTIMTRLEVEEIFLKEHALILFYIMEIIFVLRVDAHCFAHSWTHINGRASLCSSSRSYSFPILCISVLQSGGLVETSILRMRLINFPYPT